MQLLIPASIPSQAMILLGAYQSPDAPWVQPTQEFFVAWEDVKVANTTYQDLGGEF